VVVVVSLCVDLDSGKRTERRPFMCMVVYGEGVGKRGLYTFASTMKFRQLTIADIFVTSSCC
jgi:hypothetical protein